MTLLIFISYERAQSTRFSRPFLSHLIDRFSHDAAHIYFILRGAMYSFFATIFVSFV